MKYRLLSSIMTDSGCIGWKAKYRIVKGAEILRLLKPLHKCEGLNRLRFRRAIYIMCWTCGPWRFVHYIYHTQYQAISHGWYLYCFRSSLRRNCIRPRNISDAVTNTCRISIFSWGWRFFLIPHTTKGHWMIYWRQREQKVSSQGRKYFATIITFREFSRKTHSSKRKSPISRYQSVLKSFSTKLQQNERPKATWITAGKATLDTGIF